VWRDLVILVPALALVAAIAAWFFFTGGYTLYYGDAEAHLNIARSITDSRTPGPSQFGTVWLPAPHVLMLPFAGNDAWWHSGLAGAISSSICFVVAGTFLFGSVVAALGSRAAAWTSAGLFALNPNVLYLSSIPMSEPVFWAGFFGLMFTTIWFGRSGSWWALTAAALFCNWASLTRYEGWFLIPFVALYVLVAARRNRWLAAVMFTALACLGPLAWIAHNYWYAGNPLDFYNGPYSAKAIQGGKYYAGQGEWLKSWLYFRTAVRWCAGLPLCWIGAVGILAAAWKKAFGSIFLALLAPLFYVISVHGQGNPIFLPDLWTRSYYNSRYGLAAMALLVLGAGAIVAAAPPVSRVAVSAGVILVASLPWALHFSPENWICWKESQVNSEARRAWTRQAADFFRPHYRPGDGVFMDFGDQTGILREMGIPIREALHNGNNPAFIAAVQRPDLFLHERWAITMNGDAVDKAMVRTVLRGPRYVLAKTVVVKGAGPVQIYERVP
jgi:hypothetical protein